VGRIKRRQWYELPIALFVLGFGSLVTTALFGHWLAFGISAALTLLLGVTLLVSFVRGRSFLGIASTTHIIVVPMDRHKQHIRRILGLLDRKCAATVTWSLEGTAFADRATWNTEPMQHRPFNRARYILISTLFTAWGASALMKNSEPYQRHALTAFVGIIVIGAWIAYRLHREETQ